ncbi:MAG: hypothetical protein ABSF96_02695 [Steroidobacteraceae bacterium]|jgi:hypothetical protein
MNESACKSAASGAIRRNKGITGPGVRENSLAAGGWRDSTRGRGRRRRVKVARLQVHDSGFRMFRVF